MRKLPFPVAPSISRSFERFGRVPRNRTAIPVSSAVRLTFNKGWFPDREFAPHLYPMSGRDLLNILSGWRAGDMGTFTL